MARFLSRSSMSSRHVFVALAPVAFNDQIWVNLPKAKKMVPPAYQDYDPELFPVVTLAPVSADAADAAPSTVKVISGSFGGSVGPIVPSVPITFLDVRLQPGASTSVTVPAGQTGLVYLFRGAGVVGGKRVSEGVAAVIDASASDGEIVLSTPLDAAVVPVPASHLPGGASPSEGDAKRGVATFQDAAFAAIVLLGPVLDEPIARRGPFVMNTNAEIEQAFEDFYSGKIARESRSSA